MNWQLYFHDVVLIGSRYLLLASLAFLIFYVLFKKKIAGKKIQQKFPRLLDYTREIGFSILTIFIMAFIPAIVIGSPSLSKYTRFYTDIQQHSMTWFVLAFPVMAIIHDTYFYWMHRAIHHPRVFKLVHLVHHQSTNPSPFAAYSFHPLEAILEAGIFLVFVCVL